MALVDALLDKISDRALRTALRKQVDLLLDKQQYGLVFQQRRRRLYKHARDQRERLGSSRRGVVI